MINKIALVAFSAIGLSISALPVFASEVEPLRVSVPFAFTAGKSSLPAGDYTVYESESHVLTIRGTKGSILVLAAPGSDAEEEKNCLSFQHTEKGYALKSVHNSGKAASLSTGTVNAER